MAALLLLVTMWPLVSATKIYECYKRYPLVSLVIAVAFTAVGAVMWALALARGMELCVWHGTIFVSEYRFWIPLVAYVTLGILRYALFKRYDKDVVYDRLVEEAARLSFTTVK